VADDESGDRQVGADHTSSGHTTAFQAIWPSLRGAQRRSNLDVISPLRFHSLFFAPPRRKKPRIPAAKAMSVADIFLQKQQKQREAAGTGPAAGAAGSDGVSRVE
jgi:hypothetical protein